MLFSASAEIIVQSVEEAVVVPVTAIAQDGKNSYVLKVENDKVTPISIKTGISDGYFQEVIAGLQEGDQIIVNNYQMNLTTDSGNQRFGGPGMGIPPMGRP
jgi:multidrug efflux pump subunit AcrA (membrane-fusion protein)